MIWIPPVMGVLVLVVACVLIDIEQSEIVEPNARSRADYGIVPEYQIALLEVNEMIVLAEQGAEIDYDELDERVAVLNSKNMLLTIDSESNAYFRHTSSFPRLRGLIHEFQNAAQLLIHMPNVAHLGLARSVCRQLIQEINSFRSEVNTAEGEDRQATLQHVIYLQRYIWGVLACVLLMLGCWARHLVASERTHRQLAAERQAALERERRVQAQLAQSMTDRVTFLSLVSHEVRSALQGIVAGMGALQRGIRTDDGAALAERITRSALSLGRQLGDVMTLARGDAGQLQMHGSVFDVCELVRAQVDDVRAVAMAKGLSLKCTTDPQHALVWTDDTRLGQVLSNLLSNAIKYTAVGSVHVDLYLAPKVAGGGGVCAGANAGIAASMDTQCLCLKVIDTGVGIPAEFQDRMFEPFCRAGGRVDGMGLGLSVVYRLVQALGGTVRVWSEVGRGTSFEVRLPVGVVVDGPEDEDEADEAVVPLTSLAPPAPPAPSASVSLDLDGLSPRLLVVDDREDVRHALSTLGQRLGATVEVAATWDVARQRFAAAAAQARAFDLVLLDLSMPEGCGAALAAELRRRQEEGAKGAQMTTAVPWYVSISAGHDLPRAWASVFDQHLDKPISEAQLQALLETAVLRQRSVSEDSSRVA